MKLSSFMQHLYNLGVWLIRIVKLNFLWLMFILLGLGIFGIFPATASMNHVVSKWLNKHPSIDIRKEFITYYKDHFFKANLVGLIVSIMGIILYLDYVVYQQFIQSQLMYISILLICLVFLIIVLYVFPMMSRYELSVKELFKQALYVAVLSPMETIAIVFSFLLAILFYWNIPILTIIVGPLLIVVPVVWFAYNAFMKMETKQYEHQEKHNIT